MKQKVQMSLLLGMMFMSVNIFGQINEAPAEHRKMSGKSAKTYFDLMVNVVNTNLNYGPSNDAVAGYKKANKGIQGGVSFQAGITPAFSLVSEFYYIRKGGKLTTNNPLTTNESILHLNTLELPVLARFHIGNIYLNAGPSIAYNLSGRKKIGDLSTKLSFADSDEGFRRFDAGIQMGGGLVFPFKEKRIALDIRYTHGLTNLTYSGEIHNRSLMISVHFSKAWKTNPLARRKN